MQNGRSAAWLSRFRSTLAKKQSLQPAREGWSLARAPGAASSTGREPTTVAALDDGSSEEGGEIGAGAVVVSATSDCSAAARSSAFASGISPRRRSVNRALNTRVRASCAPVATRPQRFRAGRSGMPLALLRRNGSTMRRGSRFPSWRSRVRAPSPASAGDGVAPRSRRSLANWGSSARRPSGKLRPPRVRRRARLNRNALARRAR